MKDENGCFRCKIDGAVLHGRKVANDHFGSKNPDIVQRVLCNAYFDSDETTRQKDAWAKGEARLINTDPCNED